MPLQVIEIAFLWDAPLGSQKRKTYASKTKLGPLTPQELASLSSIQEALSQSFFLVHQNPQKILWIGLDTSK